MIRGDRGDMFEVITISFAFFFGLAVRQIGLPPLVGFLAAGFAINIFGPPLGLPELYRRDARACRASRRADAALHRRAQAQARTDRAAAGRRRGAPAFRHLGGGVHARAQAADGARLEHGAADRDRAVVFLDRAGRETARDQARARRVSRPHRHRHPDRAGHHRAGGARHLVGADAEYLGAARLCRAAPAPRDALAAGFRRP